MRLAASSRAGTKPEDLHRQVQLELRARARWFCRGRSHAAASAVGLPGDEAVLRALHAGGGGKHLWLQRRRLQPRRRDGHVHLHARSRRHDHVRAGVDASQPLGAADSRGRDAADVAREHRAAGRRAERPAWSRQHSGRHRLRDGLSQRSGLHPDSQGRAGIAEHVPDRGDAETAAPEFHELLGEYRSVLRQPAQGVLRKRRDQSQRLWLRRSIRNCRNRRKAPTRTGAGRTCSITCTAARWKGSSASA